MTTPYPPEPTRSEPVIPDAVQPYGAQPQAAQPRAAQPPPGYGASPGAAAYGQYGQQGAPAQGYPTGQQVQAGPTRPAVIPGRLWAGGVATSVIAALIATVGILVSRGVLNIPVLAPEESGTWGDASTVTYALVAFAAGLIGTGLMHVLLVSTPSPFSFFGWIMGLATLVAAVLPFTTSANLDSKIATAVINALIGIAIWTLTDSSARRSLVRTPR